MKHLIFGLICLSTIGANAQKISELPAATTKNGAVVPIVQGAITKKLPIDSITNPLNKRIDSVISIPFAQVDLTGILDGDFLKYQLSGNKFVRTLAPAGGGSSNVIQVVGSAKPASGNVWIDSTINRLKYILRDSTYTVAISNVQSITPPSTTYDVDAQALFTAAGTSNAYKTAVNNAIVAMMQLL